jgi:branched-chain amino acid transport system permease protein
VSPEQPLAGHAHTPVLGRLAALRTLGAGSPGGPAAARPRFWVVAAVALAALCAGPQFLSLGNVVLAITLFNLMAMAQAWNLIGGYGGQFSLGHGLFVAVGGYTTVLVLVHTGIPVAAAIVIAGVISAGIGALAAFPLLRLRGPYFSVGTLGIMIAAQSWVINWQWAGQTAGVYLPPDAVLGFNTQYYIGAGLVVGTTAIAVGAIKSRYGLRLMAVRDDEHAAQELGVNPFRVKLTAFAVSAFLVGLCGALNAFVQLNLEPYSAFNILWSVNMILACVIGGMATFPGPLIGAALIFELQQQLQSYQDLTSLIEGVILLAVIRFAPGGIWGLLCTFWDSLLVRRQSLRRPADAGST